MFSRKIGTYGTVIRGLLVLTLALGSLPAAGQSADSKPADLKFEVINATTGEPGTVDRMTIEYVSARRNGILDFEPSGSSFIAPGVPIKDGGKYIVGVWYKDVPYWWSLRGRQLLNQTTTLHVFDTTSKRNSASIKGLNLVVRRQETLLKLEFMLQVENLTQPQKTIYDGIATFELDFPAGTSSLEATYRRGPDPTPFEAKTYGGKHLSLAVPLTPGLNQIRVEAVLPWHEGMEIPVGSNLAINSWSVLSFPDWLEVRGMELESGGGGDAVPGYSRVSGPALEPGNQLPLQLFSGEHGAVEATDLFTQDSPAEVDAQKDAAQTQPKSGGLPLPFMFGGVLIIILIAVAVRKRR